MSPASLLLSRLRIRRSMVTSLTAKYQNHLFSSSTQSIPQSPPIEPRIGGLSERMSFVFDQIDAMERMRGAKDDALERIRAWRLTKKQQEQPKEEDSPTIVPSEESKIVVQEERSNLFKNEVELVHPWPEWIEFMERLVTQNYFDHRRFNEDQIVKNLPIDLPAVADDLGFDFTRDWTTVRTACLNFGRDRFDILRSLSKKDLQILVGHGCPSTDRKVVFSAKLLRKLVRLDEGDVCSSCKMRSNCSNGFLFSQKEDEARTIDVIRILLSYGFDPINSSVENKTLLENKTLKKTVRKLLQDVTRLSGVPIDPNLPPPVIKKPLPKVKQPPPAPKRRVGRDDVEMKKGDWICPKCDFMNFAKNNVCLQCDAKRPKRNLLPGEWECPQCNFLNYRRNMACFRCDHRRPPEERTETEAHFQQPILRDPRPNKFSGLSSQAWNFDFDDNESDGADVAAFEFADTPSRDLNLPDGKEVDGHGNGGRFSSDVSRTGFDDFHDEDDDDDVDSYEIDDRPVAKDTSMFGGKGASADKDDDDFDDDDGDDDDLEFHGKGHGRPGSFNQLDDSDDDGMHGPRHDAGKGRIMRTKDGFKRERSDNRFFHGPGEEKRGHSRPSFFSQLDDDVVVDDDDDDDDDTDDDNHLARRGAGMKDGLRRQRFDPRSMNGRGGETHGRGFRRQSNLSLSDDDDDDDNDTDEDNYPDRHRTGMKDDLRKQRFDPRAMIGCGGETRGRGFRRQSNVSLSDDDDVNHHRDLHVVGGGRGRGMTNGRRRERFDYQAMNMRGNDIGRRGGRHGSYNNSDDGDEYDRTRRNVGGLRRGKFERRASSGPGNGLMDRDNQFVGRSRGGFNGRGRGRRSDRSSAGSRSNEFGRGQTNRWDNGPKRF